MECNLGLGCIFSAPFSPLTPQFAQESRKNLWPGTKAEEKELEPSWANPFTLTLKACSFILLWEGCPFITQEKTGWDAFSFGSVSESEKGGKPVLRRVAYSRPTSRSRCVTTGRSRISNSPLNSIAQEPSFPKPIFHPNLQYSAIRWRLGCVNYPLQPEGATTPDHAIYYSPFSWILYVICPGPYMQTVHLVSSMSRSKLKTWN